MHQTGTKSVRSPVYNMDVLGAAFTEEIKAVPLVARPIQAPCLL